MAEEVFDLHVRRTKSSTDMATIAGLLCGFGLISAAILIGGSPGSFINPPSLLIVVGVAMDTIQQVESQLVMRHYDGFMRGSRVKGRRG